MTGTDPERLERRLRWAAEQLEINPQSAPEEVRAEWLRRLPALDFVPLSEDRAALAALLRRPRDGGWEATADEQAYAWDEEQLRGEVEAFAQQFWDKPPEERRRLWEELAHRCAFAPALRARLRQLEAGLAVGSTEPAGEDAGVVLLGRDIREQFVLRPGPRASARRLLLERIQDEREWKVAARRLRHAHPAVASLGNDLLDRLLCETPQLLLHPAEKRRRRARQPMAANSGGSSNRWPIWVAVFLVTTLVRMALRDNNSSSPPSYRVPPSLVQPPRNPEFPPMPFDQPKHQKNPFEDAQEKLKGNIYKELQKDVEAILKKYGIKDGKKNHKTDGKNR